MTYFEPYKIMTLEVCVHIGILKLKLGRNGPEYQKTIKVTQISLRNAKCWFLICENRRSLLYNVPVHTLVHCMCFLEKDRIM